MQYRRSHIPDGAEKVGFADKSHKQNETSRAPLAVLAQNTHNANNLPDHNHVCNVKFSGYGKSLLKVFNNET